MKRLFALLMTMALVIGLMAGCGGSEKQTDGSSSSAGLVDSVADSDFSTAKVEYIADGAAVYRVVRAEVADTGVISAVSSIVKNYKDNLGVKTRSVLDSEDGTDQYEILVGDTNRAESAQALDYLYQSGYGRYKDYIVCTIGKKIVINGVNDEAVAEGVVYFVENYLKAEGVEGGIKYVYATQGSFSEITINGVDIQKFQLTRDFSNRSWLIQEEARKLQEYVQEKTGYYLNLVNDKETEESEYEINIGNTIRTAKPSAGYGYSDWEIAVAGKKVYIAGGSTYSIQVAMTEFTNMVKAGNITDANSTTGDYESTVAKYDSSTYLRLKWADEFDYNGEIDMSRWALTMANQHENATQVIDGTTGEVTKGILIMRGFKLDDGSYVHHPSINTSPTMTFNYGYAELCARIADGKGIYSSYWGAGGGLEIDVFENLGVAQSFKCNIHYWGALLAPDDDDNHTSLDGVVAGSERAYVLRKGTMFDDYHAVGLYWTPDEITFIWDGEVYYTEKGDARWDGKYINLSIGFNIGWDTRTPPADDTEFPVEYHADSLRVYQVDGYGINIKK